MLTETEIIELDCSNQNSKKKMFFLETERDKNKPKEQLFEMGSNDAVTIAHRRNSLGGKNVNWSRSVDHCL